jgi:hypothetical protein
MGQIQVAISSLGQPTPDEQARWEGSPYFIRQGEGAREADTIRFQAFFSFHATYLFLITT